jgi:signal transduction histidine kinase
VELGELPVCRADPELLERVFANLVGNALKFTVESPEPRITVGARRLEDGSVAYTVADNGIGLDPDQTEQMFEPFNRLHADPRYGGTGIGLATVKRIVERHGGRVWAEGVPGAGATFCFTVGE